MGIFRHIFLATVLASASAFAVPHRFPHTFVVSDTNDNVSVTSLRGAIMRANQNGGQNTIILGTPAQRRNVRKYNLTIQGGDEDEARTGDLDITCRNLLIVSRGSNAIMDASALGDRAFHIHQGARLMLENITITCAKSASVGVGDPGGAIYNEGNLSMVDCIVTGNSASDGGGIYNAGSSTLTRCLISSNFCGGAAGQGGGIYNVGALRLQNCLVQFNFSGAGEDGAFPPDGYSALGGFPGDAGGSGGGIFNAGDLTLATCIISGNLSGNGGNGTAGKVTGAPGGPGGAGGGIYSSGKAFMNGCAVTENRAGNAGNGGPSGFIHGPTGADGGSGGGIFSSGSLSLTNCTISENMGGAGGGGGGGASDGGPGGVGGSGGAIYATGSLSLISCTVCSNVSGIGGMGGEGIIRFFDIGATNFSYGGTGGSSGTGAGIFSTTDFPATVANTLVALNESGAGGSGGAGLIMTATASTYTVGPSGPSGSGPDVSGAFHSLGFNLISVADGSTGFANAVNSDQVGSSVTPIDPMLGPLQSNGGLTPTHALLPGSPAIDQGNSFGFKTDQRGHKRPQTFPNIQPAPGGDGSDIGAYEVDPPSS